jgi:hypothetical protein
MTRCNLKRPVFASIITFILAFLIMAAPSASAQSTSTGTITGTVLDHTGAAIPNATITITDTASKAVRTATTNKEGQYVVPDVAPGSYDITAFFTGFSKDVSHGVVVSVNAQSNANFTLAVGSETTTIEVQTTTADLQTLNASTSETVDPAVTDSLPAINRDASQFSAFMPGVTPNGAVAGTVSDQAVYQLDGGNDSSDMDGSMLSYTGSNGNSTTGGFLGASSSGVMPMPQDSIEEVRVSTSGQTADFNNSSGMQTSLVTKRGHDQWHGTVYEYYLDSNIGANSWQNNFPNGSFTGSTTNGAGSTSYTPKASYHFSRFGAAAGGPISPTFWGGKTYFFANYEGFRYPLAATYERTVPSYNFMQGIMQFGATGTPYTAAALKTADPRGIGMSQSLLSFYQSQLPLSPVSNGGSTGATGTAYGGTFDQSCGALSTSYCDGVNTVGFKANIATPQSSNFLATRLDHNFGPKNQLMMSFRYYKFVTTTSNQVDIGGGFAGDKVGTPVATAPRPQDPIYFVTGLTTNLTSSLTNDVHYSYLRNYWQWKNQGDAPQVSGSPGAIEPFGESAATTVLAPYNVNAQSTRTRIWDGKDAFLRDDLTLLKGDHLIQFGGSYQHNTLYHQRTDNGNAINYSLTYQIGDASGGGNIAYSSALKALIPSGYSATNAERFMDAYYGFVTDTQVANTYTNSGGSLTLNPPFTAFSATTKVNYYNLYTTDTWHMKPSITLNYGLGYAIETPPVEQNGNQVLFTDQSGNPYQMKQFLANRESAALQGQVYNPIIGFALVHNAVYGPSNNKYPYDSFFGALSPRIAVSWSPAYKDGVLGKVIGNNLTVVRAGYGRIYGRINGDIQVLNPMLSPGLVLATQCRYAQSATSGAGGCTQPNYTDTTAFRFGGGSDDGLTAPLAAAPAKLSTPVYRPGFDGPGVAIASPVDPSYRPNVVDTFNISIQRQISRKSLVEVGYIGRLIHNELETLNPNAVPYMMSLGGQTFESAYAAVEAAFGCTTSASLCSTTGAKAGTSATSVNPVVAPQPFFEAALGGATSTYCSAYSSCTAAVVAKQAANFTAQKVFSLWSALDNNVNGAAGAGFVFPRTMMGTALSGTYGSAGQMGTGLSVATSTGWGNYNGAYVSFKITNWRGVTLQENLTYSKAMGLDDAAQSSSGLINNDSFNEHESYGVESFNQKFIFNTFIVYQPPYFADQRGITGRLLGGWTFSPVLTAGTGEPLVCTSNNGGQSFGGADGSNFTDNEQCVFNKPYTGGYHTHRGVVGTTDPLGVAVGTSVHAGGSAAAVNMFTNPVAVFDTVRPPVLGFDFHNSGEGPISGLGYLNLDVSVKKKLVVWESGSLEFTGVSTNVMNHMDFANPSLSLQSASSFGVTKTQGNSPRQIQMGIRANF